MKLTVKVQSAYLEIEPQHRAKVVRAFEPGQITTVQLIRPDVPRSHPQNRLYWQCLRTICEDGYLRDALVEILGHLRPRGLHEVLKSRAGYASTAFAGVSHDEFTAYFRHVQSVEIPFFTGLHWDYFVLCLPKHMPHKYE